jgi:hypothetical protein
MPTRAVYLRSGLEEIEARVLPGRSPARSRILRDVSGRCVARNQPGADGGRERGGDRLSGRTMGEEVPGREGIPGPFLNGPAPEHDNGDEDDNDARGCHAKGNGARWDDLTRR